MFRRAVGLALALLAQGAALAALQPAGRSRGPTVRVINQTTVVGDSDPVVWESVLGLLPERPRRIELLDLNSLSRATRQKLRGLEAFVLTGQSTIVVIRQSPTLRHAETEHAPGCLALASLVWHELAHVNGLDERGALDQEQALWRRFIATGLVDGAVGLSSIARLKEARERVSSR